MKRKSLKLKNPINRMELSDEDTDLYDELMYKINNMIEREEEMKYQNKFLVSFLKKLKSDIKSDYNSLDDIKENINDCLSAFKSLSNILK